MKIPFLESEYYFSNRGITFNLLNDTIDTNNKLYFLVGENGVGKTTFLENILLPTLKTNNQNFIYIGQDFGLQYHTIRSSLSLKKTKIINNRLKDIVIEWLTLLSDNTIMIMDEFDKYFPTLDELIKLTTEHISSYFIVSHNSQITIKSNEKYSISNIIFSISNQNNADTKKIDIGWGENA